MERLGNQMTGFCKSYIPYLSDIEKMGVYREPVAGRKPAGKAALAYRELWDEISGRITA